MTTYSRIADVTLQLSRRLPMARRYTGSAARRTIVALALAVALSGAAANVAAARGGGGGGHGGGFGHMGGGIGSDFVAGSGGGFGGHVGGFGGGPGAFGTSPVGGFEGSHFADFGSSHVGAFGAFGSHPSDPSVGRFQSAPLAIAPRRFASPSALADRTEPSRGTRISMHYRGRHRMRYYVGDCFIGADDPYYCRPNAYCPCSPLP
jgi:hypothetical protein